MTNGIYCYKDLKTNEIVYVGKDSHIDKSQRHLQHISKGKYNSQVINRIIQNNLKRYQYLILKEGNFSTKELNSLEIYYIKKFNTFEDNKKFNYTSGGEGGALSKETIEKMKKSHTGKKLSESTKKKMSESHKCKNIEVSKTTREKISNALKGRISPMYGKSHSFETKKKISKSTNSTGFFGVSKSKSNRVKQGFIYKYHYYEGNKRKSLQSIDIKKLEQKVKNKNLPWEKL